MGDFALDFLAKQNPVPCMLPGSGNYAWYFLPVMFTSRGATMPGGLQCRSGLFNPGGGCKKCPFQASMRRSSKTFPLSALADHHS